MNTNYQHDGEDELQAARRTAHALGQTEGAEQAEVAAELAASPRVRQEVEADQALAARLKEAAREVPLPVPSPALREVIERRLAEIEPATGRAAAQGPARPWWRSRLMALALTAACLVALVVPIVRSTNLLGLGKEHNVAWQQNGATSESDAGSGEQGEGRKQRTMAGQNPATGKPSARDVQSSRSTLILEMENVGSGDAEPAQMDADPIFQKPAKQTQQAGNEHYNDDSKKIDQAHAGVAGGDKPADVNTLKPTSDLPSAPKPNAYANTDRMGDGKDSKGGKGKGRSSRADAPAFGPDPKLSASAGVGFGERAPGLAAPPSVESNKDSGFEYGNRAPRLPAPATSTPPTQSDRLTYGTAVNSDAGAVGNVTLDEQNLPATKGDKKEDVRMNWRSKGQPTKDEKAAQDSGATALALLPFRGAGQIFRNNQEATPQKPLETWKPSHIVPNTSRLMVGDKEELPLKGMQVDVRVDGFRARVLIDLYYFNDHPQPLEGNFQLRLPDEASPYFFAFGRTVYQAPRITPTDSMFFKPQQVSQGDTTPEKILALRGNSWEQPKVARMVPKEKAALAYRDTVRRRVDPALVEWSGAGVFQCRVFPLAPQSMHRVTIGYDVDLLRVGDDLELRLDLPGQTPATIVDLNIAASNARQVSLDAPATASADGQRISYRLIDPKEHPLAVRLRKPGTLMLTGADEATGNYFATRVGLTLPETPTADRSKQAVFVVDTSLSAGPQFPLWTKLLRATLENNRDSIHEFAVVFFNVETFWWQEKFVANTPENVDALLDYADGLALEGATNLGRALKEAASPAWRKKADGPGPDLFLLSDGAATWGEDRWALLAATLATGHSPERKGESALFAYRTGLAGGDPRLLAYLAEQTDGAVFSLVGEAEIASASVAHRNRPWQLTGIEMAGGHDLLVAGRPQYVFPGQQLLVVGRLEQQVSGGARLGSSHTTSQPESPLMVFTLQQGKTTQTISVKMDQVLASELAARTFGQVATTQLEDASSAAAEPIATAYARHFRVTGRTCSLLMLETEQDYARFNIKPEEDSFVVKDRPAGTVVAKVAAETTAAMGDPKANFLAWYRKVRESSEVHFDLPAALNIALEGMPSETFAVTASLLQCKLRLRKDLPENLRQPWQSGLPDYETLDAEAQRRLAAYGSDDALRGLSSLVEDRPGDAALARDLAFSAIEWQRPGEAYHLLRRAATARTFEPITFHAMAHCLEVMGQTDLAIVYYELACGGQWDGRFGDMHNIAQLDYLRFLRHVAGSREKVLLAEYAKARMATLAAAQLRDTADVAALILWNTDGTDVDLHVIEPSGEECFFSHTQTRSGGHISRDVTTGFGPELYLLPDAPAGNYRVSAHYFAADANRASTRTKVLAFIYEGWGTKDEKVTVKALALTGRSENHELGTVKR
ncbi:MAG: hypothetical protein WCJ35_10105 [Planctomycetota bacterium]